jgi:hypothetical protein
MVPGGRLQSAGVRVRCEAGQVVKRVRCEEGQVVKRIRW